MPSHAAPGHLCCQPLQAGTKSQAGAHAAGKLNEGRDMVQVRLCSRSSASMFQGGWPGVQCSWFWLGEGLETRTEAHAPMCGNQAHDGSQTHRKSCICKPDALSRINKP